MLRDFFCCFVGLVFSFVMNIFVGESECEY